MKSLPAPPSQPATKSADVLTSCSFSDLSLSPADVGARSGCVVGGIGGSDELSIRVRIRESRERSQLLLVSSLSRFPLTFVYRLVVRHVG